jgi:hypothetical protein
MSVKSFTGIFISGLLLATLAYDVYAFLAGGTEATISWTIFEYSYKYPAGVFLIGFVCGHLFWQMKPDLKLQAKDK